MTDRTYLVTAKVSVEAESEAHARTIVLNAIMDEVGPRMGGRPCDPVRRGAAEMTSHELARKLLSAPDLPVVTWDAYDDRETEEVRAVLIDGGAKVSVSYQPASLYLGETEL
jgi:hypothetical protein